jgi:hypothetical protein
MKPFPFMAKIEWPQGRKRIKNPSEKRFALWNGCGKTVFS